MNLKKKSNLQIVARYLILIPTDFLSTEVQAYSTFSILYAMNRAIVLERQLAVNRIQQSTALSDPQ